MQVLEARLKEALDPLRQRNHVKDVRALGAIGVVELESGTAPPSSAFAAHRAFVRPLRGKQADVVYLMPPLVIDDDDLNIRLQAIDAVVPGTPTTS